MSNAIVLCKQTREELAERGAYLTAVLHRNFGNNKRISIERYSDNSLYAWEKTMSRNIVLSSVSIPLTAELFAAGFDFGYKSKPGKDIRDGMGYYDFNALQDEFLKLIGE